MVKTSLCVDVVAKGCTHSVDGCPLKVSGGIGTTVIEEEGFEVLFSSRHPGIINSQVSGRRWVLGVMFVPLAIESTFQCAHIPKYGTNIHSGGQ